MTDEEAEMAAEAVGAVGIELRCEVSRPVRMALLVILNHVEPGWENSVALVRMALAQSEAK